MTKTGTLARLLSFLAGRACSKQVKLASVSTTTGKRSLADEIGGEKVNGISVTPNGLAGFVVKIAFWKGGPMGSTATIALT